MNYFRIAALVVVVLLFPLGYLKGCSDEAERFASYRDTVKSIGDAQEKRTSAKIAADKHAKERFDREAKTQLDDLRARNAVLSKRLHDNASSSVLPAASASAGNLPTVCFDRAEFERGINESIGRFQDRIAELAQKGDEAIAINGICARWIESR